MSSATPKPEPTSTPALEPQKPDFNPRLLAIAAIEKSIQVDEARRAEIEQAMKIVLQDIDERLDMARKAASEGRDALKQETLAYVAAGGDIKELPDAVTFSKRTKLVYDKKEVLAAALTSPTAQHVIRRKDPELDVRAFEKAYKAGDLAWAQVEEVNDPNVSISQKLGDLLIIAESGIAGEPQS